MTIEIKWGSVSGVRTYRQAESGQVTSGEHHLTVICACPPATIVRASLLTLGFKNCDLILVPMHVASWKYKKINTLWSKPLINGLWEPVCYKVRPPLPHTPAWLPHSLFSFPLLLLLIPEMVLLNKAHASGAELP